MTTASESWSFTQSFTQGDALVTSAPATGSLVLFQQTSTAAGVAGTLAGTIDSSSTITLTGGGAGTSATGQFVRLVLNEVKGSCSCNQRKRKS